MVGIFIVAKDMHASLLLLVADECHAVELGEDQVLLLEDEGRHLPVVYVFLVRRLGADASDLVRSQHQVHHFLAELKLVTQVGCLVHQVLLLFVVFLVQIFDFSVVMLVLVSEGINDGALSHNFSLQVLVSLLHQEYLLFFLLLFLKQLLLSLLLSL